MLEVSMGHNLVLSFLKIRCRPIKKPEKAFGSCRMLWLRLSEKYKILNENDLQIGMFLCVQCRGNSLKFLVFSRRKVFK